VNSGARKETVNRQNFLVFLSVKKEKVATDIDAASHLESDLRTGNRPSVSQLLSPSTRSQSMKSVQLTQKLARLMMYLSSLPERFKEKKKSIDADRPVIQTSVRSL
jgi:hypothetical protein